VYNLGTGESYSFNEIVEMINDVLGSDVEPAYEPIPLTNYVHDTCADVSAIHEATGWEPQTSFEEASNWSVRRIPTSSPARVVSPDNSFLGSHHDPFLDSAKECSRHIARVFFLSSIGLVSSHSALSTARPPRHRSSGLQPSRIFTIGLNPR
jgi:hypothetical protein